MTYEHKPGAFTLFKNDQKQGDNSPDYKGQGVDLDGKPCWISAWIKRAEGKTTFMSLSITLKDAPTSALVKKPAGDFTGLDDDIPF